MRRMSFRGAMLAAITLAACRGEKGPDAYGNVEATEVVVSAQATGQLVTFTATVGESVAGADAAGTVDFIDTSNGNAVMCT